MLGPPGAGKGTQAVEISQSLGIPKVSSGELFRDHQKRDTELGRLAQTYMARGALVPDDVTIKMVMDWVSGIQGTGGFLLDGFPRTLPQAEALEKALAATGGIDTALYLKVPKKELVRRLSGRVLCRVCQAPFHTEYAPPKQSGRCDNCGGELYTRDDDKPEAVRKRIQVYLDETSPLVEYYRKAGTLKEIDGQSSIEQVRAELLSALKC